MDFVEKAKGFLMEPSRTFDSSKENTLVDAMKYYAVIVAVYAVLLSLLRVFADGFYLYSGLGPLGVIGGVGAGVIFVAAVVLGIIWAFLSVSMTHIMVYLVGGKGGISQTIKAVMYGSTPGSLLGWIPMIGDLARIWLLVVVIIGIRQLHSLTTVRATLVVIIPALIIALLYIAAIILALMLPPT